MKGITVAAWKMRTEHFDVGCRQAAQEMIYRGPSTFV